MNTSAITSEQTSNKAGIFNALTMLLNGIGYFGFRSFLVLYMTSEVMNLSRVEAFYIYGIFTVGLFSTQFIGGLLGDLVIGSKNAIIFGIVLQGLGILTLCLNSTTGLFIGLGIFCIGNGFYRPNFLSNYFKYYLGNSQKMDAAFLGLSVVTIIGSLIGVLIAGRIIDSFSYTISFIITAFFVLLSILPIAIVKEAEISTKHIQKGQLPKRILAIFGILCLSIIYWLVFQYFSKTTYPVFSSQGIVQIGSTFSNTLFLIAFIIACFIYVKSKYKLGIGCLLFLSIPIIFIVLNLNNLQDISTNIFILFSFLFALVEVLIMPTANVLIARYGHPKFLGILFSLLALTHLWVMKMVELFF
ncbi:MFS transporter [Flammeovirga yaeyamensis]|uniref:MFS transporter n=1 Tax=Flammeovirga yaeyamensis TaxID=367791 RepID=A0AAX1N3L6_9BACT|nr:MFS transporter [Flammeovirga yaeyamensis]MBB3700600.1 POT family proton-dependent oligopeptide transporter [Flammeovirga yaeyamensis]NMF37716.1 peptide MFS transporter [Flammeovirga yaeyamensis]QWG02025.1 MFS transporter [Flammeovirga yaeyamensis]